MGRNERNCCFLFLQLVTMIMNLKEGKRVQNFSRRSRYKKRKRRKLKRFIRCMYIDRKTASSHIVIRDYLDDLVESIDVLSLLYFLSLDTHTHTHDSAFKRFWKKKFSRILYINLFLFLIVLI